MIDRQAFVRDGYVVVRDVVDAERIATARRSINSWFVDGFDRSQLASYAARTYAPELVDAPEILALCTDAPVLSLADELVGQPLLAPESSQIALRFPQPGRHRVDPTHAPGGHVDGLPSPDNGVPNDGQVHAFTVLAGVFLSDVPADGANACFTVWPGTHHHMAAWFAEHGTRIDDPDDVYRECARIAAGPATPLDVRAGDVVFAHHLLVHTVGPHTGPDIRYAVFFRLRVRPWGEHDDAVLTDPWHEYVDLPIVR